MSAPHARPKVHNLVRLIRLGRDDWEARELEVTVTSVNVENQTFCCIGIDAKTRADRGKDPKHWRMTRRPWSEIDAVLMDKSDRSKRGVGDTCGARRKRPRTTAATASGGAGSSSGAVDFAAGAAAAASGAGSSSDAVVVDLDTEEGATGGTAGSSFGAVDIATGAAGGGGGAGSSANAETEPSSLIERELSPLFHYLHIADKLAAAVKWCVNEGADTIEELIMADAIDDMLATLHLKPIKLKNLKNRLLASQVVVQGMPVAS